MCGDLLNVEQLEQKLHYCCLELVEERGNRDRQFCLSLAAVSKYPALEMLLSWLRLHFVQRIYSDFL
jgi:hypothetical protein